MWTGYHMEHRRLLNFGGADRSRNVVGDVSGFGFVLHLVEIVTGRTFIPGPEHTFFRDDTEEGRMLIHASIADPYEANA